MCVCCVYVYVCGVCVWCVCVCVFMCVCVCGPASAMFYNDCCSVVIVVRVETVTAIGKWHLWNICFDGYCNISRCQKNSSRVQHRLAHIVHEV
jgi:hypothetical protein